MTKNADYISNGFTKILTSNLGGPWGECPFNRKLTGTPNFMCPGTPARLPGAQKVIDGQLGLSNHEQECQCRLAVAEEQGLLSQLVDIEFSGDIKFGSKLCHSR